MPRKRSPLQEIIAALNASIAAERVITRSPRTTAVAKARAASKIVKMIQQKVKLMAKAEAQRVAAAPPPQKDWKDMTKEERLREAERGCGSRTASLDAVRSAEPRSV